MERAFYQTEQQQRTEQQQSAFDALERYLPERAKEILKDDSDIGARILRAYAEVQLGNYDAALEVLPSRLDGGEAPIDADRLEVKALALADSNPESAKEIYAESLRIRNVYNPTGRTDAKKELLENLHTLLENKRSCCLMLSYGHILLAMGGKSGAAYLACAYDNLGNKELALKYAGLADSPGLEPKERPQVLLISGKVHISQDRIKKGIRLVAESLKLENSKIYDSHYALIADATERLHSLELVYSMQRVAGINTESYDEKYKLLHLDEVNQ